MSTFMKILTRINSPLYCGNVFQQTGTIFEHIQDIIRTNMLTKFHEDLNIYVTFRKKCLAPYIICTNLLTRFRKVRTINDASRVLTRKNAPSSAIIRTHVLTKFHDDRTINVASIVKNAPPPGGHVFQSTGTIFELIQDIIRTNLLTKFHDDRTINIASTLKYVLPPGVHYHKDQTVNVASRVLTSKNAPSPGDHVLQANGIIFELVQDIIRTNLLTMFYDDRTINLASRMQITLPGGHVFQPTETIFEFIQDIIGTNMLTKFHEDPTINVVSRVLTRIYYSHISPYMGKCPAPWRSCYHHQFHDYRKIDVTSRVLTCYKTLCSGSFL
ncbi:hypothetical protein DPMN_003975 [Dreissena polymorpha]|uniref:Uncharacterized protein n=1 Tax=Dreissena polymorpha TaxID=45954 RepID=A0A9D4RV96_DREPO|nr:hypothetical protein DPMN_003975 [Dreissena polymorpha]